VGCYKIYLKIRMLMGHMQGVQKIPNICIPVGNKSKDSIWLDVRAPD
jgi:hypothetical protein